MGKAKLGRVLIVDDDVVFRKLYSEILTREGFEVTEEDNGKGGLQRALEDPPSVILLDVMMPILNGLDMLKLLREDPKTRDIPVIILSALGQQKDVQAGLAQGANDYTIKGYHKPKEILTKLYALTGLAAQTKYSVVLSDIKGDALKLKKDLHLEGAFQCPACKSVMNLELVPDTVQQENHLFAARLVCTGCRKPY